MILSFQVVETGRAAAVRAVRAVPPGGTDGLLWATAYLTTDLRSGVLPELAVTGAALVTVWEDDECLERFGGHPVARRYADGYQVRMVPSRSIGAMPGLPGLPRREIPSGDRPVAALTLGRVRAHRMPAFVAAAGEAEREAARHPGCLEGVSLLRPPFVVGTFSLWRDAREMRRYTLGAYPGGHARAMELDRARHFHHDMLFSRHLPYATSGRWRGRNPLPLPADPPDQVVRLAPPTETD